MNKCKKLEKKKRKELNLESYLIQQEKKKGFAEMFKH